MRRSSSALFSATEASRMLGRPVPDYGVAVAVYTSSQVKKFGGNLPIGIVQVPLDRARQNKNNSAFFIDTRIRAYLPIHRDYFPDLDAPDRGLITSIDPGLFRRVMEEFARVNERAKGADRGGRTAPAPLNAKKATHARRQACRGRRRLRLCDIGFYHPDRSRVPAQSHNRLAMARTSRMVGGLGGPARDGDEARRRHSDG
jgi:hypothetical protein